MLELDGLYRKAKRNGDQKRLSLRQSQAARDSAVKPLVLVGRKTPINTTIIVHIDQIARLNQALAGLTLIQGFINGRIVKEQIR